MQLAQGAYHIAVVDVVMPEMDGPTMFGELRKRGVKLRLQGQPIHLLAILLQDAGNLVTREELRTQLWAADTFVDFDHSLHNAIGRIREVLGDSAAGAFDAELVEYWFAIWLLEPHPISDTTNRLRRTHIGPVPIAAFVVSIPWGACRTNRNQK